MIAVVLPPLEIAVALLVLVPMTRRLGALAAIAMLLVFVIAMVAALARGRRPDCHCFGQVHSTPVGWRTIARNVVLIVLASFVAWGASRPVGHVDAGTTAVVVALVALTVVAAFEGWMLLGLVRRYGQVLLRLEALERERPGAGAPAATPSGAPSGASAVLGQEPAPAGSPWGGLPVGDAAPDFDLTDLAGETVRLLATAERTGRAMLVFTDPGCGPCRTLMPEVAEWQRLHGERLPVIVVSSGGRDEVDAHASEVGLVNVVLDPDRRVAEGYRYLGTPGAVIIDGSGRIASRLAAGAPTIRQLLDDTVAGRRVIPVRAEPAAHNHANGHDVPPAGVPVGAVAPPFSLLDLDGDTVALSDHAGQDTLLLFWSPGCGFCQRMADDIRDWEAHAGNDGPALVLVAAGDAESNRVFGFRSPVLLDTDQAVTRSYGIGGTPIGVMIDAAGHVASAPVAGADAVFHLLRATAIA